MSISYALEELEYTRKIKKECRKLRRFGVCVHLFYLSFFIYESYQIYIKNGGVITGISLGVCFSSWLFFTVLFLELSQEYKQTLQKETNLENIIDGAMNE